jgi:hypothetical protein
MPPGIGRRRRGRFGLQRRRGVHAAACWAEATRSTGGRHSRTANDRLAGAHRAAVNRLAGDGTCLPRRSRPRRRLTGHRGTRRTLCEPRHQVGTRWHYWTRGRLASKIRFGDNGSWGDLSSRRRSGSARRRRRTRRRRYRSTGDRGRSGRFWSGRSGKGLARSGDNLTRAVRCSRRRRGHFRPARRSLGDRRRNRGRGRCRGWGSGYRGQYGCRWARRRRCR